MLSAEVLKILCCPETRQPLALADQTIVQSINVRIASGTLKNRAGTPVTTAIEGALVRQDGAVAYPIRQQIPILLVDEALPLRS